MSTYYTISNPVQFEHKINRSRFIASFKCVKSIEDAKNFISEISHEHQLANHNCWAYIVGYKGETSHSSDNGEPSGTAGVPMLNALRKHNLTNIVVVVTRYFGGVKLGIRGLIEAYNSTVDLGVNANKTTAIVPHSYYKLTVPYDFYDTLKHRFNEFNPVYDKLEYSQKIDFEMIIESKAKKVVDTYLDEWNRSGKISSEHLKDTED